jgi:hypothetical protein
LTLKKMDHVAVTVSDKTGVLPDWILQGLYCTNFEKRRRWMYIIIDILIFQVSMNSKGDKFQLGIKFLNDLIGSS